MQRINYLINENLINNKHIYRVVLAEELRRHSTTAGDLIPRKHICYRDRLQIDKNEIVALKWATDF